MDNQHRKITGYRELNQDEIDLMNRIKAMGAELHALVDDVRRAVDPATGDLAGSSDPAFNPMRWASIAATDFQTGLMALTRAVAQPETF